MFRRGDELVLRGESYSAVSRVVPLTPTIEIYRADRRSRSSGNAWAGYALSEELVDELSARQLKMWFELDDLERVSLSIGSEDAEPNFGDHEVISTEALGVRLVDQDRLACDLVVDTVTPLIGIQDVEPVLPAGTPLSRQGSTVPVKSGDVLYARWNAREGREAVLIAEVSPGQQFVNLAPDGTVRLLNERPYYHVVWTPQELLLQENQHALFQAPMTSDESYDKRRDPFNGRR
jgi:hypothetical protein